MLSAEYQDSTINLGWMESEILDALSQAMNTRIRIFSRQHLRDHGGQHIDASDYWRLHHSCDYIPEQDYDESTGSLYLLHAPNHYDRLVLDQSLVSL